MGLKARSSAVYQRSRRIPILFPVDKQWNHACGEIVAKTAGSDLQAASALVPYVLCTSFGNMGLIEFSYV